jgi:DNA polymerase-3 subunit beta
MKFISKQSEFNAILSLVSRAVSSRPTHPILGNFLIIADQTKNQVSVTAFDLSLGIRSSLAAEVSEGGTITLPAKLLTDIVSRLSEGPLTLAVPEESDADEALLATLTSASGKFQIRGLSAAEFPELPTVESQEALLIPVHALNEGLRGSLFAASTDETKQVLTGIHLAGSPDSLEFAATDGHRLAVVEAATTQSEDESKPTLSNLDGFNATIPARALRELERILAAYPDTTAIKLYIDETQVVFELGEQRLTSRKIDGAYPAYQQLIPRTFARTVSIDRKQLLSSLERVSVLSDQKNNLVKFTLDGKAGQLSLSVEAQDLGNAKESIPADITGESGEIAFNVRYLLDGLKALPASDIQMKLNEGNQPVIFTPLGGLKMTYLVMPVQIVR